MSKSVTRANSARWATSLKPAQLCVKMLPMHLVTISVFIAIPSVVAFNSVSHCSRVTKRSFFHHVPHHRRHIRIPVLASPLLYRAVVVASSPSSSPSQRVTIESHPNAIHRQKSVSKIPLRRFRLMLLGANVIFFKDECSLWCCFYYLISLYCITKLHI